MNDGSIDITDEVLAQLDYVIAGIHSNFRMPRSEMMARLQVAMSNPHVDIISHPTGRILKRREEYEVAVGELLQIARDTGTILEINSYPERLDLGDDNILAAKQAGVKMVINTDAHHIDQLRLHALRHFPGAPGLGRTGRYCQCLAGAEVFEPVEMNLPDSPAGQKFYCLARILQQRDQRCNNFGNQYNRVILLRSSL